MNLLEETSLRYDAAALCEAAVLSELQLEGPADWRYGQLWQRPDGRSVASGCEAVLAIGAFDGVHLGHREIFRAARQDADERGVPLVAITFSPDPDEAIPGVVPAKRLLLTPDRLRHLAAAGADAILALRFDDELRQTTPDDFVSRVLMEDLAIRAIHVGEDFRFGVRNSGSVADLERLGSQLGFSVCPATLVESGGERVSATRIRGLIAQGRTSLARELLGYPHFVRGRVEHGRGEGRSMGFPTANVSCSKRLCMPGEGVYAGYVVVGDKAWPAAINMGAPPSFSEAREAFLEANLIGFEGDLYERELAVVFVEWLRAARSFDSLEELESTVLSNIDWVRENLGSEGQVLG